jgi:hypothetical protein
MVCACLVRRSARSPENHAGTLHQPCPAGTAKVTPISQGREDEDQDEPFPDKTAIKCLEPISVGRDRKVPQLVEQVEKLRARRIGGLVIADESHHARRKLEADRCPVGQDGAAAARASVTPTRMSPPASSRPRNAMAAILFVLRTGCQWNALDATGICSCASAYRRFREWLDTGVFHEFWRQQGLLAYDDAKGIDWNWLSLDGAMTKAPLGGEKDRAQPYGSRQGRDQAKSPHRWRGRSRRNHG